MEQKILAATLYLKNGVPVKGSDDLTPAGDLNFLAKSYNDGGIDKIFVFDLSGGWKTLKNSYTPDASRSL